MNAPKATRKAVIAEAFSAWSSARPATAMAILARFGCDMTDRRSILRSWGVSFDDQIDYSSDSFLREAGYGPDGVEIVPCGHSRCAYEGSCQIFGGAK